VSVERVILSVGRGGFGQGVITSDAGTRMEPPHSPTVSALSTPSTSREEEAGAAPPPLGIGLYAAPARRPRPATSAARGSRNTMPSTPQMMVATPALEPSALCGEAPMPAGPKIPAGRGGGTSWQSHPLCHVRPLVVSRGECAWSIRVVFGRGRVAHPTGRTP
jgi:hypothetical protein